MMGQPWSTPKALNEDSKDVATAAASELARQMTTKAVQATAGAIAVGVGGAVAGAIAQVIFRGLWDTVFPPDSVESSTMDEMTSVVKQELKQDTLDQINGVLHDLFDMLTKDYTLDKMHSDLTDPTDRDRLHDQLTRLNEHLIGVIGTLMQESYAKIGMTSFLLLAGLRIALYQEMANVDPENEDPDFNPARSPRYATPRVGLVAQYAEKYAEHVEEWWSRILEDRRRAVVAGSAVTSTGVAVSLVGTVTEWIEDHATRRDDILVRSYSNIAAPPQPPLDTLLEEYRQQVAVKLSEKFNHPEEIVTNWRKLIDKPINMTVENGPEL
ncbi:Hypp8687 [Branchiostoma lanceolatum]|uniref:Hypp8687 protein n=1 Tax=Branchiostoma lanceolatum TaxID=7740 RepID=A0A8J9Z8G1_BRALA|nr:Hypp8687 [Branchiostoma lanceolatum]